jgi:hypothetical protein
MERAACALVCILAFGASVTTAQEATRRAPTTGAVELLVNQPAPRPPSCLGKRSGILIRRSEPSPRVSPGREGAFPNCSPQPDREVRDWST